MKYFLSPDGSLYAYESDGSQDGFIHTDFILATDDQVQARQNPELTSAQVRQAAIYALEATITPRRVREALLGADNGWLAAVDAQIAALRG